MIGQMSERVELIACSLVVPMKEGSGTTVVAIKYQNKYSPALMML